MDTGPKPHEGPCDLHGRLILARVLASARGQGTCNGYGLRVGLWVVYVVYLLESLRSRSLSFLLNMKNVRQAASQPGAAR